MRTFRKISLLLGVALALALVVRVAQAVHNEGIFQLDYVTSPTQQGAANVSSTNISPAGNTGDDWDKVYAGTSGAFTTAFITDPTGSAETSFYTGGGSKDERPISTGNQHWEWDDTNDVIPDKDDLSHAFAAAYTEPGTGHTIFYFGADRFDTSGDAEVGFWFFREPVTLGTKPNFNGEHEVGDILVLANWGGSNKVGDIAVYQWVGGNNPLDLLLDTTQADCSVAPADDPVCAVVNNTGGETPPWPYTNKDGQTSYQAAALFEGGIDLNDLLGVEDIGCFSSFLAATRSSHSTDAQLKDFALGAFPVCGIKVTKTGDTLSKVGDPVDYTITIENTGQATLYKRNINDTLLGAITTNGTNQANPYVLTNTCGASLAPGATCTITLRRTVQADDPDPLPNTVSILYSEHSDFTGLEFTSSDDHEVNLFQPAVMIEKTGDGLSKIGDSVTYTFKITNKSSQDSPNLTLASISDSVIGDLSGQATAAGCDVLTYNEECTFQVTRTVQAGDGDPLNNTVDVLYHPVGFPNDITASDGHAVNLFQPSVSITKNGDTLSKIGDEVTYRVTINNTSSSDSPSLILDSISDDVLGDLSDEAPAACDSIAPGGSCAFDVPWTVAAVDVYPADGQADDPVINTVSIHFHPDGFPNDITATASHELNLFRPSIAFSKTADTELSKATDDVNYTLTLNNTSSADTPDMVCTITDAKLGVNKTVTLASGAGDVTNVAYTVQAGDPDPLVNNASASCSPTGFPNVLNASGSWRVNLFQPSVLVEKSGDSLSKIGDTVTYHFTINNTSSADSPNLMLDSVNDSVLGSLTAPASCDNLAPGASCEFDVPWTVPQSASDPTVNTVEVHYHPVGFLNDIADTDDHSLNLFQPSITFDKSVDVNKSKAGDAADYTLTLNNTSSSDTPALSCTITDALLGISENFTLASGGNKVINKAYTFQAGDPDPFTNTANVSCRVGGFSNVLAAGDSATVDLFQPSVTIDKTGDALSKVGDVVNYTIAVTNTSSADTPNLACTLTDAKLGVNKSVTLASGASDTTNLIYTVPLSETDPLLNTASVSCSPAGFPNVLTASDGHSVNLFQSSITFSKTADHVYSKAGDAVGYVITLNNTSSADTPNLNCTISDAKLGVNKNVTLASGASDTTSATYTVQSNDPDPLVNTASVSCSPAGFPNVLAKTAQASVDLLHPAFTVSKSCKAEPISQAGPAVFTITFNNTGDADLHVVPSEGAPFDVAAGGSYSYDYSISGPFAATVGNTVTGNVTLATKYGLSNSYLFSASDSCDVKGKVKVVKTVTGQPPAAGQTFTFQLRQGASTVSEGTTLETKTTDANGNISFSTELNPGQTYQLCEWVFPGWNTNLSGDGPLFVPNSIIPPSLPNPNVNNLTVCTDFSVTSGQTRTFTVDNTPPPGGRALTIGFWKNWASCASSSGKGQKPMLDLALAYASQVTTNPPGGLVVSAQNAGTGWPNYAATWYLILKGDPTSTEANIKPAMDCLKAVRLLDKSTITTNKKKASDPLFNMTAQLVGAELNRFMGAGISGVTIMNIDRAVLLNGKYKFNGESYTPKLTTADANLANCLATQLDNYNNNRPVSSCP